MVSGHLLGCEADGHMRDKDNSSSCVPCPAGFYSTSESNKLSMFWNEWPLRCTPCFSNTGDSVYQDEAGQTNCKTCPPNTQTLAIPADDIKACTCRPGFYSPYVDVPEYDPGFDMLPSSNTLPGMPCIPCHVGEGLVGDLDISMDPCGSENMRVVDPFTQNVA